MMKSIMLGFFKKSVCNEDDLLSIILRIKLYFYLLIFLLYSIRYKLLP